MDSIFEAGAALSSLDESNEPIADHDVLSELRRIERALTETGQPIGEVLKAEILAFTLLPLRRNAESNVWGTYYGPIFVDQNEIGETITSPDINEITQDVLMYWETRAGEASHPYLAFRYSSLVWDHKGKLDRKNCSIDMARMLVASALEIVRNELCRYRNGGVECLKHALSVAISIKDTKKLAEIRSVLISNELENAQDEMCGTWGQSYDLLVEKKKSGVTEQETKLIIDELENRAIRLSKSDILTPHELEYCSLRLARFFRRNQKLDEVRRALERYANHVEAISEKVLGMVGMAWLQDTHRYLMEFGMTDLANDLNPSIHAAGKRGMTELVPIEHSFSVSDEELEAFLADIDVESFDKSLIWLALHFVPIKEQVAESIRQKAIDFRLSSMIATTRVDESGRPVANVGSVDADLEGRVAIEISNEMQFRAFFLRHAIERFEHVHCGSNGNAIVEFVASSATFNCPSNPIIVAALEHYFGGRWMEFIHLSIPQIEAGVRNVVTRNRGTTLKQGRYGSLMLRNLDELLQEPCMLQYHDTWSENVVLYLRVLLTDQRGWNLRNCVAHGLATIGSMGPVVADRLFHAILVLSLIREPEPTDQDKSRELES